jgi:lysophospholipase L1-like esterase
MKILYRAAFLVLIVLLLVSMWGNWQLYQETQVNYRELNRVRLDPLGLSVYAGEDARAPAPAGLPIVVFYGDSRAAEWTPPEDVTGVTIVNRGIGAQTTAQVLGRFAQDIAPLKPQKVVIQAGINDLKTLPLFPDEAATIIQNTKDNLAQVVQQSLDTGAEQVILTTVFPIGDIPLERQLVWSPAVDDNAFISSLASDRVRIMETAPILAGEDGMIAEGFSRDALHLNEQGYAALNRQLAVILRQ